MKNHLDFKHYGMSISIKTLILLLLFYFNSEVHAQFYIDCGSTGSSSSSSSSSSLFKSSSNTCDDWDEYENINPSNTQTKQIRITVHVFQKDDGTGNFTPYDTNGNPTGDYWHIKAMVDEISNIASNHPQMNMVTTSPHYQDSRIRSKFLTVHVWKDDDMWSRSNYSSAANGEAMYDYVDAQNIPNFNNSIHLLVPGEVYSKTGGRASGFGDLRWSTISNWHHNRQTSGNNYYPHTLIFHEIGHNVSLQHTWNENDGCDDTPQHPTHPGFQCWSINNPNDSRCDEITEVSNNVMDYNSVQRALTQCQIQRVHNFLISNPSRLQQSINVSNPVISGSNCLPSSGGAYAVSNYEFGTEVDWVVSPSSKVQNSTGCGNVANLVPTAGASGTATITFTVDWGSAGTRTVTKTFNLNQTASISGTITHAGGSQPMNTVNQTSYNLMTVNVSAPGASSFTWVKTGGTGSFSTSNSGQQLTLNISNGNSLTFNVSANTTCGMVSRSVTFYVYSGSQYRIAPNPVVDILNIQAAEDESVELPINLNETIFVVINPIIQHINLYDEQGNIVFERSFDGEIKETSINLSQLQRGIYFIEIIGNQMHHREQLLKI